ncbi:MAG: hypothetical protein ACR2NN_04080 [Bryobacteraceae bacterium]
MRWIWLLATLAFIPGAQAQLLLNTVPPCRMVDTRPEQGKPSPYGPPNLSANIERDFPLTGAGPCYLPQSAGAFSLNVTLVPFGPVNSLGVWPAGQPNLGLSTLEAPTGNTARTQAYYCQCSAGPGGREWLDRDELEQ